MCNNREMQPGPVVWCATRDSQIVGGSLTLAFWWVALARLPCPMKFPYEAKAWQTQQRRANGRKDGLRRSEGPLTCGEHTRRQVRLKWDARGSDVCLCVG